MRARGTDRAQGQRESFKRNGEGEGHVITRKCLKILLLLDEAMGQPRGVRSPAPIIWRGYRFDLTACHFNQGKHGDFFRKCYCFGRESVATHFFLVIFGMVFFFEKLGW